MQLNIHASLFASSTEIQKLSAMVGDACAWLKHYLKALHPEAAVLHLEEQLLSQNAFKLTQGVLVGPQPQLKGLPRRITTN